MNQNNIKLSIIIPHYRTPEVLTLCLDAILKDVKNISYEIIVSDGETDSGILDEFKNKYPGIIFIENKKNVGFARLANAGIGRAKGEYIFEINADIIFTNGKDILDLIEYLEKNDNVGIVAPRLFNPDGSVQQTYFRNYTLPTILARRTFLGKTRLGKKILDKFMYKDVNMSGSFEPDWVLGAAMMMASKRFAKIGGKFDERFFMYFEDADLCRRFKIAGFKIIYFPFTSFVHKHARASDRGKGIFDIFMNNLTRIHIASYLNYLIKWHIEIPLKMIYSNFKNKM